jgi:hypothetical protein
VADEVVPSAQVVGALESAWAAQLQASMRKGAAIMGAKVFRFIGIYSSV